MSRPRAVAIALAISLALAVAWWWRWPSSEAALPCDVDLVHLDDAGVARCADGAALPAAQALTIGRKLDLNSAGADELEAIPGLGGRAARALVAARAERGIFQSWDEVDRVPGIGPGRLGLLQKVSELRGFDAGAW